MDNKNTAYLTALAGLGAQPDPITRDEALLNAIADRLYAIEEGGGLPAVTSDDNGDVLTVVSGAWAKAAPSGGGRFVVSLTYDEDNDRYTADKTAEEIYTAATTGSDVVCFFDDYGTKNYYTLASTVAYSGAYHATFSRSGIVSNEFGTVGRIDQVAISLESDTPSVTVDSFETQAYIGN